MPRIVSLLPAGSEIVCALGARDELVGRSHECDYPASVRALPIVSKPTLDLDGMGQAEIDVAVANHMRTGESLYVVDEHLLRDLAPDIVLTQDLCQVCAPSGNELTRAMTTLPGKPEIIYLSPRTLAEIDENVLTIGRAIGRTREAEALVANNRTRVERMREANRARVHRPRVTFLEWVDPFYCAGHWVPEMVDIAGGDDPLGRPGEDSVRVSWEDVQACEPQILIVAPCGFNLDDSRRLATTLAPIPGARVFPVDANAFFARPGPRYVDGIEILAGIFHEAGETASVA